ncbi:MAG: bacterial Ig-like domain-containing protein [Clostridiales bacterium]|nr:bacterial Ig-like domain-containing protein [Candidatus Apopatousia equi]
MENFRKIRVVFIVIIMSFCSIIFTGCTSGQVSLFFTSYPSKIAYEIGEEVSFDGLKVEALNTDGTTTVQSISKDEISEVDTSSFGEKTVKITKGQISTTFKIYVANKVVNSKDNLKTVIENANDGDIIYIKKGEYKPDNNEDGSLYNILVNKKVVIIGDGKNSTVLHGNFLVGASESLGAYIPLENFEDVKFLNIGFKLDGSIENKYINYEGPYGNYDLYGAIKTFNTSKVLISGCSFSGYSYGINANNIDNLTMINNDFKDIKINALRVSSNIENSTISKNNFINIGFSSIVMENNKQGFVSALYLSFYKKGNLGVIISNNNFSRIGLLNGGYVYCNPGADELEANEELKLTKMSYVNNSAIIFLVSSTENNLEAGGIILSSNNYGKTLENISFGTDENNLINQSGVIINEA